MPAKTKIVCTIGPASEQVEILKQLISEGMSVARLNFSHGTHDEHRMRIANIRQAASELNREVAILLDTKGPEIRTRDVMGGEVQLEDGQPFVLTTDVIEGTAERVSITYEGLPDDVEPGRTILIDDGLIELQVERVSGPDIICRVISGGLLKNKKGVNVPGVDIRLPGLTEKDVEDILFGIGQGIDFIAASFVRKAEDVLEIRRLLERESAANIQIIAKIENQKAVDNLEEIIEVCDGLMVARGDLGVEIPSEEVPLVQKKIISRCNAVGKPVITATQMLDSMQRNPRPTRAEASDVANAIFDGTDAIMLSGETAAGKYPVESVRTMTRIAIRTEKELPYREMLRQRNREQGATITDAISQAVANTAMDLKAAAIIAPTESGYTARLIAKYRCQSPIVAITPYKSVQRQLLLSWGVIALTGRQTGSTDEMMEEAIGIALQEQAVKHGDLVILTAGVPVGQSGNTNLMKVHVIGNIIARGQGIGHQAVSGKVVVARSLDVLADEMEAGAVIVSYSTDREMIQYFQQAAAVITEEGGLTSHAAVVGLSLGIPVIVGVKDAMSVLQTGMTVTVDPERGNIYAGRAQIL
jgi:pyruvate kinase